MSDFAFKLASLGGFYADLNDFTDANGYPCLTDGDGRLPGDPGTGADFVAMAQEDAVRLDFIFVADLVSLPATETMPAVTSGPHLTVRASYASGNAAGGFEQAKMAKLLGQLAAFFGAQPLATLTPDPALVTAFGATARQCPTTARGSMLVSPVACPKFGLA